MKKIDGDDEGHGDRLYSFATQVGEGRRQPEQRVVGHDAVLQPVQQDGHAERDDETVQTALHYQQAVRHPDDGADSK